MTYDELLKLNEELRFLFSDLSLAEYNRLFKRNKALRFFRSIAKP